MCSFRSHSLFRVIPKYLNVYFNLSFLYLFIFLFLSSNYYCHVFFFFFSPLWYFFLCFHFSAFSYSFSYCVYISYCCNVIHKAIKMGIPISILPYKLHITFSPIFVIFAVIAQGIMGPYVVPYFTTSLISIFFVSLCTGLDESTSQ